MSSGKFSQPRPHRDEERQIEESFRQLTEDRPRRRKPAYDVEAEIRDTVREITEQDVSSQDYARPSLEKSAKLDQTIQSAPSQTTVRPTGSTAPRQSAAPGSNSGSIPLQTPGVRQSAPYPRQSGAFDRQSGTFDRQPEPYTHQSGAFDRQSEPYTRQAEPPRAYYPEPADYPQEPLPEEEPDFIDKLLALWEGIRRHQTPVILGLCAAGVGLIVLLVCLFFTGSKPAEDSNQVLSGNIYIAGVNVSGMTRDQAIDAVKHAADTAYPYKDMVVDLGSTRLTFSPMDTGAKLDAEAAVEAAFALPPSLGQQYVALLPYLNLNTDYIWQTLSTYAQDTGSTLTQTSYGLEGPEPVLSTDRFNANAPTQTLVITMGTPGIGFDVKDVYEKVLDAYSLSTFLVTVKNVESVSEPEPVDLEAIYREFYIEPVNASVNMQNFEPIPGSYGYEFDLESAKKLVQTAQYGEVVKIPMEYIEPEILDSDAFFRDTLGEYQTRGTGNDDRNRNLTLACSAIDDTVLNPGESLSFRSALNKVGGWRSAPEDTGLELTDKGGVTQVASTLYYAALVSDLNITSRSCHSYLPSFIDYGLDATADLSVRNTTGYPVRIEADYTGGYVRVKILGTEERSYYVMLESSISSSTAPKTVYEDFPHDNVEGYLDGDVIQEGSNGYLVKTYKLKYDRSTGREQTRDFIANSQYPVVDRIVARVEEPPTEPPTEAPTVPPTTVPPTTVPPTTVPPTTVPPTTVPPTTVPPTQPPTEPPAPSSEPQAPTESVPPATETPVTEGSAISQDDQVPESENG